MADFVQEGQNASSKGLIYNVSKQRNNLVEHSNSTDVGLGSRTHVVGDVCFLNFNTFSWVTVSNPHKGVPEKCRSLRLCEGV